MQGMRFLMLDKNGLPFNHGIIAKEITPTKYLCQFTRTPASARVCDITEIETWHIFATDEAMNVFIATLSKEKPAAPPTDPKLKKKKKSGKPAKVPKKSGRKTNGKN